MQQLGQLDACSTGSEFGNMFPLTLRIQACRAPKLTLGYESICMLLLGGTFRTLALQEEATSKKMLKDLDSCIYLLCRQLSRCHCALLPYYVAYR